MSELWHRRRDLGENRSAYDAFSHYRDMPPGGRTVDGAFRLHRRVCRKKPENDVAQAPGLWKRWKLLYQWEIRIDAYDIHVEQVEGLTKREAIRAMNERHGSIAAALQSKVVDRLQKLTPDDIAKMSPLVLAQVLEKASLVERRARGQATDIVRTQKALDADYSKLTTEELETLERLHAKAEAGE